MQENQNTNSSLIVTGYIISLLPFLLLPIVFTPVGVLIGILNISKREEIHGIFQIILAIGAGITGAYIGGAGFGLPRLH